MNPIQSHLLNVGCSPDLSSRYDTSNDRGHLLPSRGTHGLLRSSLDILNEYVPLAPHVQRIIDSGSCDQDPKPVLKRPLPPPAAAPAWSMRPLSDIRELTEPSLNDKSRLSPKRGLFENFHITRSESLSRRPSRKEGNNRGRSSPVPSPANHADESSVYSIPPGSVPPRSSSRPRRTNSKSSSCRVMLDPPPFPLRVAPEDIPSTGHRASSPAKDADLHYYPVCSKEARRIRPRTFRRDFTTTEIVDCPFSRHHRITLKLDLVAALFVGGGNIEGAVRITIGDPDRVRHKRALALARISVDLVGVEEATGPRRDVFINLATELIDSENPPPHGMVESERQISPVDPYWLLTPSESVVPFSLSLPLDIGPPPFQSKHAKIRYMLSVTLLVRDQGKQYFVRTSQDVSVLSVYDPEKALVSLPSPLTATDQYVKNRDNGVDTIQVTASIHRQVWVSGTSIFVDVHIANNSRKAIKKLEMQLERDVLCYKHAAASTLEKSASQARIFDSNERTILSRTAIKSGGGSWSGVAARSTGMRTCDLELPRGHATVTCGKFFEVRYFINVVIYSAHSKLVTVQLPIVLIHMNSLDVVPNSVAQVATAIEEKRGYHDVSTDGSPAHRIPRRPSTTQSVQGRAFAAPRMQSLDRMRSQQQEILKLGEVLDSSPRKLLQQEVPLRHVRSVEHSYHTPPSNRKGRVIQDNDAIIIKRNLRHVRSSDTDSSNCSKPHTPAGSAVRGISRGPRASSALELRRFDMRENIYSRPSIDADASMMAEKFRARLEAARETAKERQAQFNQFKKKKSGERWRGAVGDWLGWGGERSKNKENDGDNWI